MMLELCNAGKRFNNAWLFKNLNISVQPGDFISILGPSGCGKSTLLRILSGLDTLTEGQLKHTSLAIPGFVFQESCLLPWLTVFENVAIGFPDNKGDAHEKENQISKMLKVVKLEQWRNHYPQQLSGGMKMRVSIARALVNNKSVLYLDEPFAALDDFIRFELQEELLDYWKQHKLTVFFVTHSVMESVFLSQKLWLFPQGSNSKFSVQTLSKTSETPSDYRKSESYFKSVTAISERLQKEDISFDPNLLTIDPKNSNRIYLLT